MPQLERKALASLTGPVGVFVCGIYMEQLTASEKSEKLEKIEQQGDRAFKQFFNALKRMNAWEKVSEHFKRKKKNAPHSDFERLRVIDIPLPKGARRMRDEEFEAMAKQEVADCKREIEETRTEMKKMDTEKSELKKQHRLWKGTKSEWVQRILETYNKPNGKRKYRSLRDAINKEFSRYSFDDENFTQEKAYNLARQLNHSREFS